MNSYGFGNALNFVATFYERRTKKQVNPGSVVLRLWQPGGEEINPTPTNPAMGTFQVVNFVPTLAGVWKYRWEGTGDVIAAREEFFEVRPSQFQDAAS